MEEDKKKRKEEERQEADRKYKQELVELVSTGPVRITQVETKETK